MQFSPDLPNCLYMPPCQLCYGLVVFPFQEFLFQNGDTGTDSTGPRPKELLEIPLIRTAKTVEGNVAERSAQILQMR